MTSTTAMPKDAALQPDATTLRPVAQATSAAARAAAPGPAGPAQPDIVDRFLAYLAELRPDLAQDAAAVAQLELAVREEFGGGDPHYIRARPRRDTAQAVLAEFQGRNVSEVARRLGISRATVYRVIRQPGGRK